MEIKKQLIICLGPICSGKTTWSLEALKLEPNTYFRFCYDEFLQMIRGKIESDMESAYAATTICSNLLMRRSVIVDGFPLFGTVINRLLNYKYAYNAEATIRLFDVKIDEAIKRNVQRSKKTGILFSVEQMRGYEEIYNEFITSDEFNNLKSSCDVIVDDFVSSNLNLIM